ncbi:MAG: hypothetical protein II523_06650 [Bacteroidales bacterium]|nr:hypothetical protein [Bacteroidales bacterium]
MKIGFLAVFTSNLFDKPTTIVLNTIDNRLVIRYKLPTAISDGSYLDGLNRMHRNMLGNTIGLGSNLLATFPKHFSKHGPTFGSSLS